MTTCCRECPHGGTATDPELQKLTGRSAESTLMFQLHLLHSYINKHSCLWRTEKSGCSLPPCAPKGTLSITSCGGSGVSFICLPAVHSLQATCLGFSVCKCLSSVCRPILQSIRADYAILFSFLSLNKNHETKTFYKIL